MKIPEIPANERERIASLHDYAILDTPMEDAFDDLAKIAAHVMGAPIALVSLVDADRQWFKARFGLDVTELPRQVSFCGHVVADDASMVVADTLLDARFVDNPLVTGDPHIRYYAGVPLRSPEGFVLGALCAIDQVPRSTTPEQLETLRLLGQQVVYLLEQRGTRLMTLAEREHARASVRRIEVLFDSMAEGVVLQNSVGEIVVSNRAASAILGLTEEQMRGLTSIDPRWRAIHEDGSPYPGEDHPAILALRTGEAQRNAVMGVHKPSGDLTWISINAIPTEREDGAGIEVITTFHDITALRRASEQLALQDRLVMTGTLVAGVGHEINNPLAFVMGNVDLALEELRSLAGPSPSGRLRDLLEMLGDAKVGAERIRRIVRGLRALAREEFVLQPVEISAVVETSLSMALHELRHKATVCVDLDGVPAVEGDESRITQVLVNLLVNAAQAFETADPDTNFVTIRGAVVGEDKVRLSVIDNGPGIAPEIFPRVFDAFFTTKAVGDGTGLGLAVSRGIVNALGGTLTVESEVGAGTTFHVTLPVARAREVEQRASPAATQGSSARVLVIDDDTLVLSTLGKVLAREHDVTTISDPREAERTLAADQSFDVIVCDLMMPHISGAELFRRVRATHPAVSERFVFVTGAATHSETEHFLSQVPNDVLEKPFTMADLLAVVRRNILRRPPP